MLLAIMFLTVPIALSVMISSAVSLKFSAVKSFFFLPFACAKPLIYGEYPSISAVTEAATNAPLVTLPVVIVTNVPTAVPKPAAATPSEIFFLFTTFETALAPAETIPAATETAPIKIHDAPSTSIRVTGLLSQ